MWNVQAPIPDQVIDTPRVASAEKTAGTFVASESRLWVDLDRKGVNGSGAAAPMRILVVKVDHIGDLILAFPAVELLRKAWPGAHLTLVCAPNNVGLAKATELFDEIIGFQVFHRIFGRQERDAAAAL